MSNSYHFHVNVFAAPACDVAQTAVSLRGIAISKLTQPDGTPLRVERPLGIVWEDTATQLEALPRMIFEPDGSFVWSGGSEGTRWQVDGHLYEFYFDDQPQLHRLELHGQCSPDVFDELLSCVGWPERNLVFELVMEGVALDEANFRRWAAASHPD